MNTDNSCTSFYQYGDSIGMYQPTCGDVTNMSFNLALDQHNDSLIQLKLVSDLFSPPQTPSQDKEPESSLHFTYFEKIVGYWQGDYHHFLCATQLNDRRSDLYFSDYN